MALRGVASQDASSKLRRQTAELVFHVREGKFQTAEPKAILEAEQLRPRHFTVDDANLPRVTPRLRAHVIPNGTHLGMWGAKEL